MVRRLCYIFQSLLREPMKKIKVRSTSGRYEIWCGRGVAPNQPGRLGVSRNRVRCFLISSPRVGKNNLGARIERISGGSSRDNLVRMIGGREESFHCRKSLPATGARGGRPPRFACCRWWRGCWRRGRVRCGKLCSWNRAGAHPDDARAQVEQCRGAKTGVNLPEGKNLVGAFYPAN